MPIRIYDESEGDREKRRLKAQGRMGLPSGQRGRDWAAGLERRARTPGAMQQDFAPRAYERPSYGREALERYGSSFREINRDWLAEQNPEAVERIQEMHRRHLNQRTANLGGDSGSLNLGGSGGGSRGDVALAWPKMRDPFRYWREKAWFWIEDDFNESLRKLREWSNLLYLTHPLIPTCIDMYARFPLMGAEYRYPKDHRVADFANELFFDELNMQQHLFDMGREYWRSGESFSLGSWNADIGAWDGWQLMNPDDVEITKNPGLSQYDYHLRVPEAIRRLVETQEPREDYVTLVQQFPQVVRWVREQKAVPVSDVLFKHVAFMPTPWSDHGVPILMRAFRTLMLEMSLEAAQDAVADRLYSPFILVKVGIEDADDEGPWIPPPEEIAGVRDDIQVNLMSDFRLMVYHSGIDIANVFGRENMPRLDLDFDRCDMKVLQVFGIGREMLEGGKAGIPYNTGAMNREVFNNNLRSATEWAQTYMRDRWRVVADANEIWEYEKVGGRMVPIMDRVILEREDGEEVIEERPRLAEPEAYFQSMSLRDENLDRAFMSQLRAEGVPISDETMMVGLPGVDFEGELDAVRLEKLRKMRAELEFQRQLFLMIYASTLEGDPMPVPMEYAQAYIAWVQQAQSIAAPVAAPDVTSPPPTPNITPGGAMQGLGAGADGGTTPQEGSTDTQGAALAVAGPAGMPPAFSAIAENVERMRITGAAVRAVQEEIRRRATEDKPWAKKAATKARRDYRAALKESERRSAAEAEEAAQATTEDAGEPYWQNPDWAMPEDQTKTFTFAGREEYTDENMEYGKPHEERTRVRMKVSRKLKRNPLNDQARADAGGLVRFAKALESEVPPMPNVDDPLSDPKPEWAQKDEEEAPQADPSANGHREAEDDGDGPLLG